MLVTDLRHKVTPVPLHFLSVLDYHLQLPAVLQPSVVLRQTGSEGYWHIFWSVYPVIRPVHSALQSGPTIVSQGFEACYTGLYAVENKRRLHLCGETIEAVAHVGDAGNQPDFGACW